MYASVYICPPPHQKGPTDGTDWVGEIDRNARMCARAFPKESNDETRARSMRVLGPGAVSWNRAGRSRRPIRLFYHVGASCRPKTEGGRHDQDRDTASQSQCALIDGLTAFGLEQRPIKTDCLPSGNSTKAAQRTYLTGRPTDDDRRQQCGLVGYTSANWSHLGASRERAKHVEWGHTAGIGMVCAPLGRRRGRPLGRNTCEPRLFFSVRQMG